MQHSMRGGLLCILGLSVFFGCANPPSMPQTYPVSGTVVTLKGTPYSGGTIQFRLEKNQELTVTGKIEDNGTFRLYSIKGKRRSDGAPVGSYEVVISPPVGPDQKMPFFPFTAPKKYKVEAKDNNFKIQADPPAKTMSPGTDEK
jgi:hypothetical protein